MNNHNDDLFTEEIDIKMNTLATLNTTIFDKERFI